MLSVLRYELYVYIEKRDAQILPQLIVNLHGLEGSTGECTLFCPLQRTPLNNNIIVSLLLTAKLKRRYIADLTYLMFLGIIYDIFPL